MMPTPGLIIASTTSDFSGVPDGVQMWKGIRINKQSGTGTEPPKVLFVISAFWTFSSFWMWFGVKCYLPVFNFKC